jgi:G2/mitotic-specific cyclin 2
VTRAKAAATESDLKRSKSTTATTLNATQNRKRAALGDVSNVAKNDLGASKTGGKKALVPKETSLTKAAQPSKVLKRSQSTRSTLTTKVKATTHSDLKRKDPASGSGASSHVAKKRQRSSGESQSIVLDETQEAENIAPSTTVTEMKRSVKVEETIETEVLVEPVPPTPKELPADVLDLDTEDLEDPLMVAEYVVEIFEYFKELEPQTMANSNYIEDQPDLEWQMRGILVDWLLEVHQKFRLLPETLFLAVNIIDRFLSFKVVQLDRLQLVGVTALFIASKYEEVLSPHVSNFRHVADDAFTEEEILSAERFVLTALNYDISRYPNPMNFLRRISKADNYDVQTRTLGKYLLEISCLDHRFIGHPPSQIAAAAMYMARLVLDRGEWVCLHFAAVKFVLTRPRTLPFPTMLDTPKRSSCHASSSWSIIYMDPSDTTRSSRNTPTRSL